MFDIQIIVYMVGNYSRKFEKSGKQIKKYVIFVTSKN